MSVLGVELHKNGGNTLWETGNRCGEEAFGTKTHRSMMREDTVWNEISLCRRAT